MFTSPATTEKIVCPCPVKVSTRKSMLIENYKNQQERKKVV